VVQLRNRLAPRGPESINARYRLLAAAGENQFKSGVESSGQFFYYTPPTIRAFETSRTPDCSGVLALVEPGSQSKHDFWLLVIGAALSAGVAVFIELILKRPGAKQLTAPVVEELP
jgi:hypothetical protein